MRVKCASRLERISSAVRGHTDYLFDSFIIYFKPSLPPHNNGDHKVTCNILLLTADAYLHAFSMKWSAALWAALPMRSFL